MAITHGSATRDAICNAVVDRLDLGSPGPAKLNFLTAGDVAIAELVLSSPAFGNASGGTAAAAAITSDTSADAGTTTKFTLTDKSGVVIIAGTVGTSLADINLSSVNFGAGDTVSVSSLNYSAMP